MSIFRTPKEQVLHAIAVNSYLWQEQQQLIDRSLSELGQGYVANAKRRILERKLQKAQAEVLRWGSFNSIILEGNASERIAALEQMIRALRIPFRTWLLAILTVPISYRVMMAIWDVKSDVDAVRQMRYELRTSA